MATCTTVIELDTITAPPSKNLQNEDNGDTYSLNRPIGSPNRRLSEANESLTRPNSFSEQVQRWNSPRINVYRLFAAFWGFIIMGANDAVIGVRL